MMRFRLLCVLWATFLAAASALLAQSAQKEFAEHLSYLASDELRGRGNYHPEIDVAAEYIADAFRRHGLEPGAGEEGYFQTFDLPVIAKAGSRNFLSLRNRRLRIKAADGDFKLFGYGERTSDRLVGELLFAGYGISAPELNYDDYRNIDALGKIVLVMEHEPQETLHSSRFRGAEPTPYSSLRYKVANAGDHGAAAVLVMPDSLHHPSWWAEAFEDEDTPLERLGLPAFRVSNAWAKRFFAFSLTDLGQLQRYIDVGPRPFSLPLRGWEAEIEVDVREAGQQVKNVLGFLPGSSDEVLIIGAHYDHMGLGDEVPDSAFQGEIHNGADDNASGTAGLLYLARKLSQGPPLQRGVLLIAFAGEELGLLGSRHFVQSPTLDPSQVIAMFNMDMIGRSPGDLLLAGVGTAQEFQSLLSTIQMDSPL
ncbi:MAG: M28 family peptidase, partial [Acidobacteriota bacterium]